MTSCYLPPPTWQERAYNAARAKLRTARMVWRQFRATFSPKGWVYIGLMAVFIIGGATLAVTIGNPFYHEQGVKK